MGGTHATRAGLVPPTPKNNRGDTEINLLPGQSEEKHIL